MAVVFIKNKVTIEDIKIASEEYGSFIKIVIDLKSPNVTIGGEWHVDGENSLLENGSKQSDLWGGGIDTDSKEISFSAMTNIKPGLNTSHVIMDAKIRDKFTKIVREKFNYE